MAKPKYAYLNILLLAALVVGVICSLSFGKVNFELGSLFEGGVKSVAARIVLFEIRLPRTIIAALSGGGLALSGAVLQSYLRNPLADSGVLGVSAFATLGAIIAIYFGVSAVGIWVIPVFAISLAILSLLLLLLLVGNGGTIVFVLAGVVLSALAGGLMALLLSLAPNPYALSEMIDWQIGGFNDVSNNEVLIATPLIVLGSLVLLKLGRPLEAFSLGEETAQSLGVNIKDLRLKLVIGVGFVVGAIGAVCGVISFVGLIVPHLMRPLVKDNPRLLLLPSFLFGALFTIAADVMVRFLWLGAELKLGVIMTLLGAPFFIYLLLNLRKKALN